MGKMNKIPGKEKGSPNGGSGPMSMKGGASATKKAQSDAAMRPSKMYDMAAAKKKVR